MTIEIIVRHVESGALAEHRVYNQPSGWAEEDAREWVAKTELGEWEYASHREIE